MAFWRFFVNEGGGVAMESRVWGETDERDNCVKKGGTMMVFRFFYLNLPSVICPAGIVGI